jgi:Type I phosphodiesterase / nucleotide pyrophosphatase
MFNIFLRQSRSWDAFGCRRAFIGFCTVLLLLLTHQNKGFARNVILIVADGLRQGSVNDVDAPTMNRLRKEGVFFSNSHALFPTLTTPNASAIAAGHGLGDTGDFGNFLYVGYPLSFLGQTQVPFIESDRVIANLNGHFAGNYLGEETLITVAARHGYNTAAIGKVGPIVIQAVSEARLVRANAPRTVIIDDATGKSGGIPVDSRIAKAIAEAGLPAAAPDRANGAPPKTEKDNGFTGNNSTPGTREPNRVQQQYFVDVFTKVVLPLFVQEGKPFVAVFWSRDPDGTQHNQGDSLNKLSPGINGPTSKAAVRNADDNLRQIMEFVESRPGLADDTDIFLTSDHGFSTISRHDINPTGDAFTASYAATQTYKDATGRLEVNTGFLPPGFLAIDIAHHLSLPLFDADSTVTIVGTEQYKPIDPTIGRPTPEKSVRPLLGNCLIGGTGTLAAPSDAVIVVAANGGSDLIYANRSDSAFIGDLVDFISSLDYVSGIFTDPKFGPVNGALALTDINLKGSTALPVPAIVVNFRSFSVDPSKPLQSAVTICDAALQQGQGMHGNFSRADTLNNMGAIGPDFKKGYIDDTPLSNADIAPTLAHILGLDLSGNGHLVNRVAEEALTGGPASTPYQTGLKQSAASASGMKTILRYEKVGNVYYFDCAGFEGRTVGLSGGG